MTKKDADNAVITERVEDSAKANVEKDTEKKAVVALVQPKEVRSESRIYIGPRIKGVVPGTVFTGGLTPMLEQAVAKTPAIAELIIPVSELREANKGLEDPDSALSRFYNLAAMRGD